MPRMELIAAVLSSKLGSWLQGKIDIPILRRSVMVQQHGSTRLHSQCVKEVQTLLIQQMLLCHRAHKVNVSSDNNPSEILTRGLQSNETSRINTWLHDPEFLWKPFDSNEDTNIRYQGGRSWDRQSKDVTTCAVLTVQQANLFLSAIGKFSSWLKLQHSLCVSFITLVIHKNTTWRWEAKLRVSNRSQLRNWSYQETRSAC